MITNFSIDNHFLFYEKKEKEVFKQALQDIKKEYETKNQEIFNSKWRKQQGYIPHGTRSKTITTIFGKLIYTRHRYRYWKDNKYHYVYLSDQYLGIEKYQRITNHLKLKILSMVAKGKRYQDILDCFPVLNLNLQTISNIIKKTTIKNLSTLMENNSNKITINQTLYVNLDDTFLNLKINNKKHKYRIRVILFHTGYQKKSNKKKNNILDNKRIFYFLIKQKEKINPQEFKKQVYELAQKVYTNVDQSQIIISGDGAPWIRHCSEQWANSYYVLDKFHAMRKIKYLFNPKKTKFKIIYSQLKTFFKQGSYKSIMEKLNEVTFFDHAKNQQLEELRIYFKNNKIGICNQNINNNIGCSIENTISHNIKWLLGYGSKAFSKQVYSQILNFHFAYINKINIINIIQKNIIHETEKKCLFFYEKYWKKTNII